MTDVAIGVRGLAKHFGKVVALSGVDFEVPAGTVLGLLGPNGAGKTTVVRILSTILRPDGGTAEVLGRDVVREPEAVRRRIGLAGQNAAVDANLTGRENLEMVGILAQMRKPDIKPRALELLERFQLTEAADRPLRTYSGGMRRRLDIAASLVSKPLVLFLDEPTTGLDITSRNELWQMIRELVGDGTTVLLTTQYLEEADILASRIAVVDGGRVIANDTPDALKAQLGSTVFEMDIPAGGERAEGLLAPIVKGRVEREGDHLRITSEHGARALIEILRTLDAADLEPESLAVREPSLDDVFLALTGHHAEAEAGETAVSSSTGDAA
ncbi:MAG: ATP-binding cassette domain-containing protein [Actinomycetota bacterium]